jgi:hypothetical protein
MLPIDDAFKQIVTIAALVVGIAALAYGLVRTALVLRTPEPVYPRPAFAAPPPHQMSINPFALEYDTTALGRR